MSVFDEDQANAAQALSMAQANPAGDALAKAQAEVDKVARWIAVVAGTSTDPTAIVEVVIELTNRLSPAEDEYHNAADEALRTDAAVFWMTNRVAELQQRKAMIDADIENLRQRQKEAVDAHTKVEDHLRDKPW